MDPRGAKRVGEERSALSFFDGGDSHAGGDGLGVGERPVRLGAARVGRYWIGASQRVVRPRETGVHLLAPTADGL